MNSKNTYAVAMIGIPDNERHVLTNIFKLSLYRAHSYKLATTDDPMEILVVDADDPKAMAEWRTFRSDGTTQPAFGQNIKPKIPTVMVTKEKLSDSLPYYIRRPFVATRVLGVLDQLVSKELSVTRERVIGETPPPKPVMPTPVTQEPVPQEPPKTPPPVVEEPPAFKALIVDDSRPVRKQIELELKLFGIQVDSAESGEQAFDLLDQKTYNLIFLDVVLPGIDGYQICKTIKRDKTRKKTPIVMLTGKSSPFDRVKGALAGCDTYLTKPVKQASFQKVVKKYLDKK
ncbi:MAG: response regulator [Candidatus Competibacteraceae bacterium]|jgi:twitching motility two-component system response regulator PilG|nr:response regulator [Candidatus Competibacteraceae bacterium]